jgi:hypothetical protein
VLRISLLAALLMAPALAFAQEKGEIDWSRRVIKARGQGAPDLSAPSISVARLGAERAAKADAMRTLLETLKGASVESGGRAGDLLQNDSALLVRVQGVLRGFRVVPAAPGKPNPRYYSDGGVAIEVELPIDTLPEELRTAIRPPPAAAEAVARTPPSVFIVDASGFGEAPEGVKIVEEGGPALDLRPREIVPKLADARAKAPKGTPILRAVNVDGPNVVLAPEDTARLRTSPNVSIILVAR